MTLNPNQFKGPFYHGSPRRFESGDHVKPGIEGHAFATTDKEKAETYAYGHGGVYEVEPMDSSDVTPGVTHDWEFTSKAGWRVK